MNHIENTQKPGIPVSSPGSLEINPSAPVISQEASTSAWSAMATDSIHDAFLSSPVKEFINFRSSLIRSSSVASCPAKRWVNRLSQLSPKDGTVNPPSEAITNIEAVVDHCRAF